MALYVNAHHREVFGQLLGTCATRREKVFMKCLTFCPSLSLRFIHLNNCPRLQVRIRQAISSRAAKALSTHPLVHSLTVLEKSLVIMMTQTQDFVRFAQKSRFSTAPVQPAHVRPNATTSDETIGPIER